MSKVYFVYIMTNVTNNVFYIGFTSNLIRRVHEHRNSLVDGFTKKYNLVKCVYFEAGEGYDGVLTREKQLKNWTRAKKIKLIEKTNPNWIDLHSQINS